jgi:hypothetical protein
MLANYGVVRAKPKETDEVGTDFGLSRPVFQGAGT